MAAALALILFALNCPPAWAEPKPRDEEWWFGSWQITQKVWPLSEGEGVTVGLIDTGVEARLPELDGVVLPGKGYDRALSPDGRVDSDTKLGGHGTGMAALIAGQGSGSGMVGIAPKSRILPVSAASNDYDRPIRYAVDHGAKVISMSEGMAVGKCPDNVQKAVSYAVQHDVVLVAAAGNGSAYDSAISPANCHGVLTVGAVDMHLNSWDNSTPGTNVMLAAPGVSVGSIGKAGIFTPGENGTSSATALTSAVVALMRSHFPSMSGREIVQRMLATARDVGPEGWDKKTGYGALVPYKALTAQVPADSPNPVYQGLDDMASTQHGAVEKSEPLSDASKSSSGSDFKSIVLIWGAAAVVAIGLLGAGLAFVLSKRRKTIGGRLRLIRPGRRT